MGRRLLRNLVLRIQLTNQFISSFRVFTFPWSVFISKNTMQFWAVYVLSTGANHAFVAFFFSGRIHNTNLNTSTLYLQVSLRLYTCIHKPTMDTKMWNNQTVWIRQFLACNIQEHKNQIKGAMWQLGISMSIVIFLMSIK